MRISHMVGEVQKRIRASTIVRETIAALVGYSQRKGYILVELEVGAATMTAMEAIIEHLSMERANDRLNTG